jgi:methanol dehydrogenase (cytochrome c) subunit 2
MNKTKNGVIVVGAAILMAIGTSAMAYDGTKCKESGLCWEAKPGFPDKIKGTKFDPKHSKAELDKQTKANMGMEERNAKRAENFKKTGKWVY